MLQIPFYALALLCLCVAAAPLLATAQTTAPISPTPLPIALPDGAKLQTELDGTDSDILGMVKGLLAGIADPSAVAGAPNKAGTTVTKDAAPTDAMPDWMKVLTDGELTALLKDVHHLHFVAFTVPPQATGVTGGSGDIVAFYEKPIQAVGGHRLLWQGGDPQILIEGGEPGTGFTAVYRGGIHVVVVRADGYPNMKIIGSLVRTFFTTGETPFTGNGSTQGNSDVKPAKRGGIVAPKKAVKGH